MDIKQEQHDQQDPNIVEQAKKNWHTPMFSRLKGQETAGGSGSDDEAFNNS